MEKIPGIVLNFEHSFLLENIYDIQFALMFGGMVFLFILEGFFLQDGSQDGCLRSQNKRWLTNLVLALFNYFFLIVVMLLLSNITYRFSPTSPILKSFEFSDIPNFIIVLLLMELSYYWIHWLNHKVPMLWRIHRVHHSDIRVDVTTSYRHHPVEVLIGSLLITPVILLLGAPLLSIAIYNLLRIIFSLISHSELLISDKFNNLLRWFIVTPNFHRVHHSSNRKFTDSNYGSIIPLFDYVFNTNQTLLKKDLHDMELGIETMRGSKDNSLGQVLLSPFK